MSELDESFHNLIRKLIEHSPVNPTPDFQVEDCVEYMVYVVDHTSFSVRVEKARVLAVLPDSQYQIIINEDSPQKTRTELAYGKDLFPCTDNG